jgi:hypothetical protein
MVCQSLSVSTGLPDLTLQMTTVNSEREWTVWPASEAILLNQSIPSLSDAIMLIKNPPYIIGKLNMEEQRQTFHS